LSPTARVSHSAGPCSTLCASEPPRRGMSARYAEPRKRRRFVPSSRPGGRAGKHNAHVRAHASDICPLCGPARTQKASHVHNPPSHARATVVLVRRALVHVGRQVILSRRRARLVLGEEREPLPSKRARRGHAIDEAGAHSPARRACMLQDSIIQPCVRCLHGSFSFMNELGTRQCLGLEVDSTGLGGRLYT